MQSGRVIGMCEGVGRSVCGTQDAMELLNSLTEQSAPHSNQCDATIGAFCLAPSLLQMRMKDFIVSAHLWAFDSELCKKRVSHGLAKNSKNSHGIPSDSHTISSLNGNEQVVDDPQMKVFTFIGEIEAMSNMNDLLAVDYLKRAVLAGNSYAVFILGVCFFDGFGVQQDTEKAMELFQKAATMGNVHAMHKLGVCYFNGFCVAEDKDLAIKLFQQASDAGHADAMFRLAVCYDNEGDNVEIDESHRLFKHAADMGNIDAINALNEGHPPLIRSPFNDIKSFDNPEAFPDLKLVVPGIAEPLWLHKITLAKASDFISAKLRNRENIIEWPFDTSREVDRDALIKALRFCYGESLRRRLKSEECVAMIAVFIRLQMKYTDNLVSTLTNFAVNEAKRDLDTGVELLKACMRYPECCDMNKFRVSKQLAAVVFTKVNLRERYKRVVDGCLMVLPHEYLMLVEYGEPHTRFSELYLRSKYIRYNFDDLSMDEKQAIMGQCGFSLDCQELKELQLSSVVDDELLKAYQEALESCGVDEDL